MSKRRPEDIKVACGTQGAVNLANIRVGPIRETSVGFTCVGCLQDCARGIPVLARAVTLVGVQGDIGLACEECFERFTGSCG